MEPLDGSSPKGSPPAQKRARTSPDEMALPPQEESNETYHTYSHTHMVNGELGAVYVKKKAYFTYPSLNNARINFLLDETNTNTNFFNILLQLHKKAHKNSPNHLLLSIEAGYEAGENGSIQWIHSPIYYDCEQNSLVTNHKAVWENDFWNYKPSPPKNKDTNNTLHNIKFVDFCSAACGEPYALNNNCVILFPNTEEIKSFLEKEKITFQPTEKDIPHTEAQAVYNLYKYRDPIFNSLCAGKKKESFKAIIIRFHSYNDICIDCQKTIKEFQPFFLNELKKIFLNLEFVTYASIANQVWARNRGITKIHNNRDHQCVDHPNESDKMLRRYWSCLEGSQYTISFPRHILKNSNFIKEISLSSNNGFLFSYVKNHQSKTIITQINKAISELNALKEYYGGTT